MIYCNLAGLMANKKVNLSEVSKDTKISRTTLTSLYYNYLRGVQIETIDIDVPIKLFQNLLKN